MRFVAIGGDAAGMSAASRAKRNLNDWDVTVFEQGFDVSYSACGMPYNIADPGRDINDLVVRQARVFKEKQGIDLKTGHCVNKIDRGKKIVSGITLDGNQFTVSYDKLLIATGASPIIPDLPGFDLNGVMALKSLDSGRRIKEYIRARNVNKIAIIGMGYIALEMCEAFRAVGIDVSVVKPRPGFIPWMSPNLSKVVQDEVVKNGIKLYLGHKIMGIEETGANRLRVICEDLSIDCHMVLVAVGVWPNSRLAGEAGLNLGVANSISVERDMTTSDKDIYAAGDCADAYHVVTGKKVWIPLALRANRAGWAVADHLSGQNVQLDGVAGTAVFKTFDLQVARTGLGIEEAKKEGFEPVETVIESRSRAHAHPGSTTIYAQMVGDRRSGRLLGAQMVGCEGVAHRINAIAVALHQKMTVESFSQCDLAYAPPFSPVWDPTLTAANQLLKML
ncbi:Pyridine nucleotide-disulphide oxidoreductase dimerisation region [uncultured Desulfobacterium sp.]|uniref:Pyridine nucleotide-disulphide oxidoreductase dimerisation region n=1 Tax=uncultured Desulfobacterium sp. TaxID=201089 RepID=A0A445MZ01_9BACT|nr:Pyridine nucleotide-disulphide oxidoreductase dimerisation region [uncultured Desulfobacterium sp.]